MVRPKFCRKINCMPGNNYFKPRGIPLSALDEIVLHLDEFEAVRLADYECLYQEKAAEIMNISRQTFGRIIDSAHKKIAEALIFGKAIKIEGGNYQMDDMRKFQCFDCNHIWEIPYGIGRPSECPNCKKANFHRLDKGSMNKNSGEALEKNETENISQGNLQGRGYGRGQRQGKGNCFGKKNK